MDSLKRIGELTGVFARLGQRRPWTVVLGALLVTVAGIWGGSQLKIDPDLKALLPPHYASVSRLEELQRRVGNQSDFMVEINSPDRAANIKFGHALARRMERLPELRYVLFHRDLTFFKDNALLYLPLPDLLKLRRRVIDRIRKEVVDSVVVDLDDDEEDGNGEQTDDLFEVDLNKWSKKYFSGAAAPSEYMEADQGRVLVVKARPVEQTTNMAFSVRLVDQVQQIISDLNPRAYHPRMNVIVRSNYAQQADETQGFLSDLVSAVGLAVGLLLLVIAGYFRTLRSIPIVLLPVIIATVATLGLGTLIFGVLNLVSIFIFAILLGLGIDFGIHILSRYQFERGRGHDTAQALEISLSSTGSALFAGAMTTVVVFFLLQLGEFRGFSQFGALAGIGVLLALLATFFLVPALITLTERVRPYRPRGETRGAPGPRGQDGDQATPVRLGRRPVIISSLIVLLCLGTGLISLLGAEEIAFEYDFNKLERLPEPIPAGKPAPPPRMPAHKRAVGVVTTGPPAIAICETAEQCETISRRLRSILMLNHRDLARLRGLAGGTAPDAAESDQAPPPAQDASEVRDDDDASLDDDQDRSPDEFASIEASYAGGRLSSEQRRELLSAFGLPRLEEMKHFLQAFLSLQLFIPRQQATKLRIIKDIRRRIDDKRGLLCEETDEKVDRWYRYLRIERPVQASQLPGWVRQQLGQIDGKVGRFVVFWTGGLKADYRTASRLHQAFFDLPTAQASVPVAATFFVLVEVINTLKTDGPVVLGAVTLAVFICLLVSFRSARAALLVLVPLMVSIGWLAGLHLLLGWKLNMFSVVAFPLLVGIGIDNGIHVYHRWVETHSLRVVLREVGGPISLTAGTTFIGFAGLLMTSHQGIRSLGLTAAVGIGLCLVGSVLTLPALLYTVHALRKKACTPRAPKGPAPG